MFSINNNTGKRIHTWLRRGGSKVFNLCRDVDYWGRWCFKDESFYKLVLSHYSFNNSFPRKAK